MDFMTASAIVLSAAAIAGIFAGAAVKIWGGRASEPISADSNYTGLKTSIDAVAQNLRDMLQSHNEHERERAQSWVTTQKLFQELKDLLTETDTEADKQRAEILHKLAMIEQEFANVQKYRIE